jgi:hypothetical protein
MHPALTYNGNQLKQHNLKHKEQKGKIHTIQHYMYCLPLFLGTFASFRKATSSFFMSVRPEFGFHWTDVHKI